jgi:hypothetical protein
MLLEAVFDHLVLPPKLQPASDDNPAALNRELTTRLLDACRQVRCDESEAVWNAVEASLLLTQPLNGSSVSKEELIAALSEVARKGSSGWLILHVVQQNAALLIHKNARYGV